jgi:hypothetical protein
MIFGEEHGDEINALKEQLVRMTEVRDLAMRRAAWADEILRDYPKGQDDGSWLKRRAKFLGEIAP